MSKPWLRWLVVLLVVLLGGGAVGAVVWLQASPPIGKIILSLTGVNTCVWLAWGVWNWWHLRPVRTGGLLTLSGIATGLLAWWLHLAVQPGWAVALLGAWAMIALFYLGLALIRLALSPAHPVLGVARTLIDEAVRMRITALFLAGFVLVVPFVPPLILEEGNLLRYRVQNFLTYSLMGTSLLLSVMTLTLACWTVSRELSQRQIHLTLTKPVRRGEYLLGKWLGLGLLNLLLVAVAGGSIYVVARSLARQPALGIEDRMALEEEVLTARASLKPLPAEGGMRQGASGQAEFPPVQDQHANYLRRLRQLHQDARDPAEQRRYPSPGDLEFLDAAGDAPEARRQRQARAQALWESQPLERGIRQQIENAVQEQWHTMPARQWRGFLFTGIPSRGVHAVKLKDGTRLSGTIVQYDEKGLTLESGGQKRQIPADQVEWGWTQLVQLRFRVQAGERPADGLVPLAVRVNGEWLPLRFGREWLVPQLRVPDNVAQVYYIPIWAVRDGQLLVEFFNGDATRPGAGLATTVMFVPDKGLEVLSPAGSFEWNLVRALGVLWIKLQFLAMLGLMASTFLGFWVAIAVAGSVFLVAAGSGYVAQSLEYYGDLPLQGQNLAGWEWLRMALAQFWEHLTSGRLGEAFKTAVRVLGTGIINVLPSFDRYDAGVLLSDGRLVPPALVRGAALNLGLFWSGLAGALAWWLFRRRELAEVTV